MKRKASRSSCATLQCWGLFFFTLRLCAEVNASFLLSPYTFCIYIFQRTSLVLCGLNLKEGLYCADN